MSRPQRLGAVVLLLLQAGLGQMVCRRLAVIDGGRLPTPLGASGSRTIDDSVNGSFRLCVCGLNG